MTTSEKETWLKDGLWRLSHLGARTLTAYAAALIAAILFFAAPEIGIIGAIGGVVIGGISAVLMRPHA